ncbi:MAG: rhomboid family intramembrane serine protease [Actinobacteria bacterium]|nr:rhomboid family intramembrane serine protease [Actinomycetota bacterium]
MTSGGPDLFVICKHCGSEVSPYITECPYCGSRLRKRAPKLDRDGRLAEKERRRARRRAPAPSLGPLRRGEMPGIRPDGRPYATGALVGASLVLFVLLRADVVNLVDVAIVGRPTGAWWHVLTAPFAYENSGYAFVALFAIALFGWLVERRHGPLAVALLFLAGGAGGMAVVAATETFPTALGGNGAALALLVAWALPDLRAARRGREIDGDLLGAAVFGVVLLLLPIAVDWADPLAGATGLVAGVALGYPLARLAAAR